MTTNPNSNARILAMSKLYSQNLSVSFSAPCVVLKTDHSFIISEEIVLFPLVEAFVDAIKLGDSSGFPSYEICNHTLSDWAEETQSCYELLFNESNYDYLIGDKDKFLIEFYNYSNSVLRADNVNKHIKTYSDDLSQQCSEKRMKAEIPEAHSNVEKVTHVTLKERLSIFKDLNFEQIDVAIGEDVVDKMEEKESFEAMLNISLENIPYTSLFQTERDLVQRRMMPLTCIFPYPNFNLISNAQFPGFKTEPDNRETITNTIGESNLKNCLRASNYEDLMNVIYLPRTGKSETGLGFLHDSTDAFVFWHDKKSTTVKVAHFNLIDNAGTKQFFYTLIEHSQQQETRD